MSRGGRGALFEKNSEKVDFCRKQEKTAAGRQVTEWGVTFRALGRAPAGSTCLYCSSAEPDESGGVKIVDAAGTLHEDCAPAWFTSRDKTR
jgi:hypothetical protein